MARPSLFDERASLNVYFDKAQKEALIREALITETSPSAVIRALINKYLVKVSPPVDFNTLPVIRRRGTIDR